jgi:TPR repeat protein
MQEVSADYTRACREYDKGNYVVAYEHFYTLAAEGDTSSQLNIGNMLLNGVGSEKNVDKAYEWYKKAADNADSEAQYIYGRYCIERGKDNEGIEYLVRSGDGGYADAVYDLAGFFLHGLHTCSTDLEKAMTLYEQAAFMGKREALSALFYTKRMQNGQLKTMFYFLKNIFTLAKSSKGKA